MSATRRIGEGFHVVEGLLARVLFARSIEGMRHILDAAGLGRRPAPTVCARGMHSRSDSQWRVELGDHLLSGGRNPGSRSTSSTVVSAAHRLRNDPWQIYSC